MRFDSDLINSLSLVVSRIGELLDDSQFRKSLRAVARAVLELIPEESQAPLNSPELTQIQGPANAAGDQRNVGIGKAVHDDTLSAIAAGEFARHSKTNPPDDYSPRESNGSQSANPDSYRDRPLTAAEAIERLTLGQSKTTTFARAESRTNAAEPSSASRSLADESWDMENLALIRQRVQLKADAARWAVERRRLLRAGQDYSSMVKPKDKEFIDAAKRLPNCYLLTNNSDCPEPEDVSAFEQLAQCYDNLYDAVGLIETVHELGDREQSLSEVMKLVAESKSALRGAIRQIGFEGFDYDQQAIYNWLRDMGRRCSIYIERYMQAGDIADPSNSENLAERIRAYEEKLRAENSRRRKIKRLLSKLRFEAGKIVAGKGDTERPLNTILRTIDELVPSLIPPSHVDLRSALLPIWNELENLEELNPSAEQVMREIERFLASNPAAEPEPRQDITLSEEVLKVREWLRGKSVMMIGGERRPQRQAAIERAFELEELVWESTRPHTSLSAFKPTIARPEIAVVLLAIRWCSHAYSELDSSCQEHDKPLVRLPAGTNANQIAHQILQQIGDRLSAP